MNQRLTDDYRVRLEAFEGPLDLLLYLIRKNEVEITDIPVASIAREYIAFLDQTPQVDIEAAGEFLVMAATLMEIKSRMLMPAAEAGAAEQGTPREAEDPRAGLVRQLLEFKKYRDAAMELESRFDDWQKRFPVAPPRVDDEALRKVIEESQGPDLDFEDISLSDLVEAFRGVMDTVNLERLGAHEVTYDDIPVELHAEDVLDWLRRETGGEAIQRATPGEVPLVDGRPAVEFSRLFAGRRRQEMVGLFLALLQLVKNRRVRVRQESISGTIYIAEREEATEGEAAEAQPTDTQGSTGRSDSGEGKS